MATHEKKRHEQPGQSHLQSQPQSRPTMSPEAMPSTWHRGTMTPNRGFEPLRQMREEFDHMFDRFFRSWPSLWSGGGRSEYWGLDVEEKDDAVLVRAEAPGFEPQDFDVQVRGNQLVLCACHRQAPPETEGKLQQWSERELYRSVTLPAEVTTDNVQANYRNGVLTLTLPKTKPSSSQRIQVQG